jgi:hypothetical protein
MQVKDIFISFVVVVVIAVLLIVILGPSVHTALDGVHNTVVNTQSTTNLPASLDSLLRALGGK